MIETRRLAAILAADMAGYSALMSADEARTVRDLKDHQTVVLPLISERGGRVIDTAGDGILAEFASVVNAVECAVAIQKIMALRNAAVEPTRYMQYRIGVNIGDVIYDDTRIYGDGVNVAARLEGLAEPGGICISGSVFDQVKGKLDLAFDDLGSKKVKNITEPVRAYRVHIGIERVVKPDRQHSGIHPPLPDKPSIAVLPFQNMSGDPEQDYFADGIVDDIISGLSRIREFFVIARNSTFTYKGKAVDVRQIGRELGVRYVLEGSVRKVGRRVRIAAQLVEAGTGAHIWANHYDRNLEDIFAVQDEITQTVVGMLGPELSRAEQQRALMKPPESLDAWELFHRGMFHLYKRTLEDNVEARRQFERAIERDSTFAEPYAGISRTLSVDWILLAPDKNANRAFEMGKRSVELNERSAMSHLAFGIVQILIRRDGAAALRSIEEAIRLNPNDAQQYSMKGMALTILGRAEEAITHLEQAIRLSPSDSMIGIFYGRLAMANLVLGRFEEAVEWGRKAEQRTKVWIERIALPAALTMLGRDGEARQACEEFRSLYPNVTLQIVRDNEPTVYPPYQNVLLEGLRKAGLPEC